MKRPSASVLLTCYGLLVILFIYGPIVTMIVFSFKNAPGPGLPIGQLSIEWYRALWADWIIVSAIVRAFSLAIVAGIATTVLCIVTSLALRGKFRGRDTIFYLCMLAIVMPGVVLSLGARLMYKILGMSLSLWTALPVHVIWALPFALVLMMARYDPQLIEYEEAARVLGASESQVFRRITFPLTFPQILAAALFGFTLSFGELLRSVFVVGGQPTLPLFMFGWVTAAAFTPEFYALGAVVATFSVVLLLIAGVVGARGAAKQLLGGA